MIAVPSDAVKFDGSNWPAHVDMSTRRGFTPHEPTAAATRSSEMIDGATHTPAAVAAPTPTMRRRAGSGRSTVPPSALASGP
ncbi:MAG: hypothetical protein R2695_02950 [Acidimicrobiales bacterium]